MVTFVLLYSKRIYQYYASLGTDRYIIKQVQHFLSIHLSTYHFIRHSIYPSIFLSLSIYLLACVSFLSLFIYQSVIYSSFVLSLLCIIKAPTDNKTGVTCKQIYCNQHLIIYIYGRWAPKKGIIHCSKQAALISTQRHEEKYYELQLTRVFK